MATLSNKFKIAFQKWKGTSDETASLRLKSIVADDVVELEFEDYGRSCTLTLPDDESASYYVDVGGSKALSDWATKVNEHCESGGCDTEKVLNFIATSFIEASAEGFPEDDGYDEYGYDGYDEGGADYNDVMNEFHVETTTTKNNEKQVDPVEQEIQRQRSDKLFLENIGSKGATMRLFDDLKNVKRMKSKELGFSCEPVTINGKMNLYEWEVRMFDFEGPLAKDMKDYQSKMGKNYVALSMKFSADYPFKPPFIRVIEPRFMFRTGHVTLGGAICMELLTVSGWTANNDITSILIQVRAEIGSKDGGARLAGPSDQASYTPYTESEAWNAFYRAASTHGWKTEGLGANMFPKIDI